MRKNKDFKIYAFSSPFATRESYAAYAECGFNTVLIDRNYAIPGTARYREVLTWCDELGLEAVPMAYIVDEKGKRWTDFPVLGDDTDYAAFPAFGGVFFWDEPELKYLQELAARAEDFQSRFPDKDFYINLSCCYNDPELAARFPNGYDRVREFFRLYSEGVLDKLRGSKILSTDYYPLEEKEGVRRVTHDYLWPFDSFSEVCREKGYDLHFYIQSTGGWDSENTAGWRSRDIVCEGDLRFQCLVALAYGVRGIAYFTYQSIAAFGYTALESADGLTEKYYFAQKVNAEINTFLPVFLSYRHVGTGLVCGENVSPFTQSNLKAMRHNRTSFRDIVIESSTHDLVVGEFFGASGESGYLLVSFTEPSQPCAGSVTLDIGDRAVRVYRRGTESAEKPEGGKITLHTESGDGLFIALSGGGK